MDGVLCCTFGYVFGTDLCPNNILQFFCGAFCSSLMMKGFLLLAWRLRLGLFGIGTAVLKEKHGKVLKSPFDVMLDACASLLSLEGI